MEPAPPLLGNFPLSETERLRGEVFDLRQQLAIARHHAACLRETLLPIDTELARLLAELEHVKAELRRAST
jgi:hypothetical protein